MRFKLHSRHLHFGTGCQCKCKSDFSSCVSAKDVVYFINYYIKYGCNKLIVLIKFRQVCENQTFYKLLKQLASSLQIEVLTINLHQDC